MLAQQVAKKYSRALFELALEKNQLDQAWEQFGAINEYLKKDSSFIDFITAPQVNDTDKYDLIKKVFAPIMEKTFYDFLLVLVSKRRIQFLSDIINSLDGLIREEKGIMKAVCLTASPINDSERSALIERLKAKTDKKIELQEKIDKSLIGGMVVMLNNQIIDGSIQYGLSQLKNRLMKVKVH